MLDVAFSLFDYFIKWTEKKDGNLDEYFELYVKPAYETAEKVFSDFLDLLHNLKKKVWMDAPLEELVTFLEDGRVKYLPLRRHLYAEVENRWGPAFDIDTLPRFEKGLIRLLIGNLSAFEFDGHDVYTMGNLSVYDKGPYYFREGPPKHLFPEEYRHTLKDLERLIISLHRALFENPMSPTDQAPRRETFRDPCILYINDQLATIEHAWNDVVIGYSEYKAMVAKTPAQVKKLASKGRKLPDE